MKAEMCHERLSRFIPRSKALIGKSIEGGHVGTKTRWRLSLHFGPHRRDLLLCIPVAIETVHPAHFVHSKLREIERFHLMGLLRFGPSSGTHQNKQQSRNLSSADLGILSCEPSLRTVTFCDRGRERGEQRASVWSVQHSRFQRRSRERRRQENSTAWFTPLADVMVSRQCVVLLAGLGLVAGFHVPVPSRPLSRTRPIPSMSTTASQEAVGAGTTAGSEGVFDWNKQWYPMLSLKDTDTGRAHAVQVSFRAEYMTRPGR